MSSAAKLTLGERRQFRWVDAAMTFSPVTSRDAGTLIVWSRVARGPLGAMVA